MARQTHVGSGRREDFIRLPRRHWEVRGLEYHVRPRDGGMEDMILLPLK